MLGNQDKLLSWERERWEQEKSKENGRRKGKAVKRQIGFVAFSDSDDPANAYTEAGKQFQSPGKQKEPPAGAGYFSDTEAMASTGETVCQIIDSILVGATEVETVSETAEQYEFIHDLNHPEIAVRRVKHSEFPKTQLNPSHRWYNALHACSFGCKRFRTIFISACKITNALKRT